jgi:hypothetical protein
VAVWKEERTGSLITLMESEPDPAGRPLRLVGHVIEHATRDRMEVSLLATALDPRVAPVLQRVTEQRIGYLANLFGEIGSTARTSGGTSFQRLPGARATRHATPGVPPEVRHPQRRYLDTVMSAPRISRADTMWCPIGGGARLIGVRLPHSMDSRIKLNLSVDGSIATANWT